MAQHGDELLPQFGSFPFVQQGRLADPQPFLHVQMEADQIGEQLEHADRLGFVQTGGPGVYGAQGAEEPPVRTVDRHRDIALETIHSRRRVAAENFILRDIIDDHKLAAVADLIANRGLNLQFTARLETERDLIAYSAGDPTIFGYPRHRRETQTRGAAHDFKNRRHGVDSP